MVCVGTADRLCIIEETLNDVCEWMQKFHASVIIVGGDFNSDLDKPNSASDLINTFVKDNHLYRCDQLQNNTNKQFTFYNDSLGAQSTIDFFFINDKKAVSRFDVIDTNCNLSDHVPISIECSVDMSRCCNLTHQTPTAATHSATASVSHLRWDHGNLPQYRDLTCGLLQPILEELTEHENCHDVSVDVLDQIYRKITDCLSFGSDACVPRRRQNFFKFWWDQDLDELKLKSSASCSVWKASGRPRSGPIFDNYSKDKAAYRHGLRSRQVAETEVYTNELHEALMKKQGSLFWKCWNSKLDKSKQMVNNVDGITDSAVIDDHFVSHFSKACSSNNATTASQLKRTYDDMRKDYCGSWVDNTSKFDAELVDSVISKMKKGKAADLDNITAEHLQFCSAMLPCVLAKLFNLCISAGCVPESFGRSYTVPILKDKNAVFSKTITVDDFRGISISPVISKVFEHCIIDRFGDYFLTSDNQFGFKKKLSCSHAIYTLRCVVDAYVNSGSTVNICALDLSKAFDKMNHCGLFIKLMQRRIPNNLLSIFEHWFSACSSCVLTWALISLAFSV